MVASIVELDSSAVDTKCSPSSLSTDKWNNTAGQDQWRLHFKPLQCEQLRWCEEYSVVIWSSVFHHLPFSVQTFGMLEMGENKRPDNFNSLRGKCGWACPFFILIHCCNTEGKVKISTRLLWNHQKGMASMTIYFFLPSWFRKISVNIMF